MNATDYTHLINTPNAIHSNQTLALGKMVADFPFFQSARALYLKGLYNQDDFRYNSELKITAAHTADRTVLFDFITSDSFILIHKNAYQEKIAVLHNFTVNESEIIQKEKNKIIQPNPLKNSILTSIKEASLPSKTEEKNYISESIIEATEEKLEIGKPLDFSKDEKHSFQEWLQLSKTQPIARDDAKLNVEQQSELEIDRNKKTALIDKFIEASPKIPPLKQNELLKIVTEQSKEDISYLMTETLARVYLEQKKYQKAIQAYEILILKYPEKISSFADRISDIKILQHNNK